MDGNKLKISCIFDFLANRAQYVQTSHIISNCIFQLLLHLSYVLCIWLNILIIPMNVLWSLKTVNLLNFQGLQYKALLQFVKTIVRVMVNQKNYFLLYNLGKFDCFSCSLIFKILTFILKYYQPNKFGWPEKCWRNNKSIQYTQVF